MFNTFGFFRVKQAIKQRRNAIANKWKKLGIQARLQESQSATNQSTDNTDASRTASKVQMADIATLLLAAKNSTLPDSEETVAKM